MENSRYSICWTCWKSIQGYERVKGDDRYDELQKIIEGLLQDQPDTSAFKGQILSLESQIHLLKSEISNLKYQIEQTQGIDQSLIKTLLIFCHPDKNSNREVESGEITKTLLALREKKK
jgi:hypothetical protein